MANQDSKPLMTPDGQWISYDGGETFSRVPGYIPQPLRDDFLTVDDEGIPVAHTSARRAVM